MIVALGTVTKISTSMKLELVEHIPRVPWCFASGFYPGDDRACAG